MLKRFMCKHAWVLVDAPIFVGANTYGCTKCGKTKEVYSYEFKQWKFKREYKGDVFE